MDNGLDKRSDGSTKSRRSRKSTVSDGGAGRAVNDIHSDDISISQLEIMANKKKLTKKPTTEFSDEGADADTGAGAGAGGYPDISGGYKSPDRYAKSSSLNSTSSDSYDRDRSKRREKDVQRENRNDQIRKEKSEYLYKFNKLNVKGRWSSLRLDMNSSIDEIRNEYERVRNEIQSERSVAFFKRMLLLGVQGVEMLNTKFDPMGVDLDGWSEAMGYSLENQEYDEVLAELYQKYKGAGEMSPEVKLIFMIVSSATMFTISKKITKLDSSNAFSNMIGSLVSKAPPPQQSAPQQYYGGDDDSETTEDFTPSKMREPPAGGLNTADKLDISQILKTMNERKIERAQDEDSDDVFKSIPIQNKTKRRGRPKKAGSKVELNF
jgi:hypothetical protein